MLHRLATLALGFSLSCGERDASSTASPATGDAAAARSSTVRFQTPTDEPGLRIELSSASPLGPEGERLPETPTRPASAEQVQTLLSRVPALPAEEPRTFNRRAGSLPAPRPGVEVELTFPPAEQPSAPQPVSGPLRVLRASPEGEVELAPHLALTFDRPFVALMSQDEAAAVVPAVLSPQPEGQWRWLGTRTLLFEPSGQGGRLPMATEYTVRVPAGTAAADGSSLAEEFVTTLRTPPPQLVASSPGGAPTSLEPTLFLAFDQQIDPAAIRSGLRLEAGGKRYPLREAPADDDLAGLIASSDARGPSRWLAVQPSAPLPAATTFSLVVPKGAPSAEGPLRTTVDQSVSFQTRGPLSLTETRCGYRDQCSPWDTISLVMSNPLDVESFQTSFVNVDPELPDAQIYVSGSTIQIDGLKQPRTRYAITVSSALKDVFGQALGKTAQTSVTTGAGEPASPTLYVPGPEVRVLDPAGPPAVGLYTVNLERVRLRVYRVQPEDYAAYRTWKSQDGWWDPGQPLRDPPGQRLVDEKLRVASEPDRMVETMVDLLPYLGQLPGHLIVWLEAEGDSRVRQQSAVWAQRTTLGLTGWADAGTMVGWVNDLETGAPAEGVSFALEPTGPRLSTDSKGLARGELPASGDGPQVLVARRGEDSVLMPLDGGYQTGPSWLKYQPSDWLSWFVFDDRKMYKPGEEVRVKGWLRRVGGGTTGDVGLPGDVQSLTWILNDARGAEISRGTASLSALGGFDLRLPLPDTMNLGSAWVQLMVEGGSFHQSSTAHGFEVQEFRRPEYEVLASASPGPHLLGEVSTATVSARYYAGGGLPGATTTWRLSPSWAEYRPPGHEEWQFGVWVPHWWGRWWSPPEPPLPGPAPYVTTTDSAGDHHLSMHFAALGTPRPVQVQAEAVVEDVNRQAWAASTSLLVHPSRAYVGLKLDRTFGKVGEKVGVEAIAVDIDGAPLQGRAIALSWWTTRGTRDKSGGWVEEEKDRGSCERSSTGDNAQSCTFSPSLGGRYTIQATVTDEQGRPNRTELSLWVAGDTGVLPEERGLPLESVLLIPDKESYGPGETAEILVQSPFGPAHGVLTVRRSGLVETRPFEITGDSTVLTLPLLDAHVPNLILQVDLVGSSSRADAPNGPKRPAYARGELTIEVPPLLRTLDVQVSAAESELEPGGSTTLDLRVSDAMGQPVKDAELVVVVVDEAVLALTGYRIADPLATFYVQRGGDVREEHLRSLVWLGDASDAGPGGAPTGGSRNRSLGMEGGGGMDKMMPMMVAESTAMAPPSPMRSAEEDNAGDAAAAGPAIALRTDLSALALFLPAERTDSQGRLSVPVKLPDNLTRYRVTVLAVSGGTKMGSAESTLTARLPLMLRPSLPRFLNLGDEAELPFVVQNQTDQPMSVVLAARGAGLEMPATGLLFDVPARDRVEVRLPARAGTVGTATVQAAISGKGTASGKARALSGADAAQLSLPVWTPATAEAFATYGDLGGSESLASYRIQAPAEVWPEHGGLEISTSSTALQALTDALIYLVDYPFLCAEQRASRVLAIAALRDVLTAFNVPDLPSAEALNAAVEQDLAELARQQNGDGGFGFWRQGERSWPFVSVHVAHALARAESKGYTLPGNLRARALAYLRHIDRHLPSDYPLAVRQSLRAYALYVRELLGDADGKEALKLYREAGLPTQSGSGLSIEGLAWLLPTLHGAQEAKTVQEILAFIDSRIDQTAATASITTSYGEGDYLLLHSDRRTDAAVLDALLRVAPDSDLPPPLVRGLLGHRVKGRWGSTQENAFVLLALDRYFQAYESQTPDFVARAWLGPAFAGQHAFKGRTAENVSLTVPMADLQELAGSGADLLVQRQGSGRLYYRLGLRYAPKDLDLEAADRGFVVQRSYEAVDDPADVRRAEDGAWEVRAGARVRVQLTMVADGRRTHVALIDPLAAGLEAINSALAVSESLPVAEADRPVGRWWWGPWYQHENMRDERAEAFTSYLSAGVYEYSYVARATTPGSYVVPPARAEEMYQPETFGRSATDRLRVVVR